MLERPPLSPKRDFTETLGPLPLPPGRTVGDALEAEIGEVAHHVMVQGLLEAVHGLVAVLNTNRQIVALNDSLLEAVAGGRLRAVLGLRLGEALHCPHALSAPGGCGTTEYCHSCGAAIAQVVALTRDVPSEQLCAIDVANGEAAPTHVFLRVRVSPMPLAGHRYLLLFLEDVSQEQRAALLEQAFLHDLSNTAMGLSAGIHLITHGPRDVDPVLSAEIVHLSERLTREIELHRCLVHSALGQFTPRASEVSVARVFSDLAAALNHHPSRKGRFIVFDPPPVGLVVCVDFIILQRILTNMLLNALEATGEGREIRLCCSREAAGVRFCVWNPDRIPETVVPRIFQRNFSTKGKLGRGLGTYAMKLLGEEVLGGRVWFETGEEQGTRFFLELKS